MTDEFDIVFDTLATSRKFPNLTADPRVALVMGRDSEHTVQIEGIADLRLG